MAKITKAVLFSLLATLSLTPNTVLYVSAVLKKGFIPTGPILN